MSQYSQTIGSFIRNSNYPLEADYIFQSKEALKVWEENNRGYLHDGLFKVVVLEDKQILYWYYNNTFEPIIESDTLENLAQVIEQLQSSDSISSLLKDLQETYSSKLKALQQELDETQLGAGLNGDGSFDKLNMKNTNYLNGSRSIVEALKALDRAVANVIADALIQDAYYDSSTEELVIIFTTGSDDKTEEKEVRIDLNSLIREWEPDNSDSNKVVELTREEVYEDGVDKLSADVRLSSNEHNILKKDGNTLLVEGTSNNITHNGTNLDEYLSNLDNKINDALTSEDLGDYYNKSEVDSKISEEISKIEGPSLEDYYTKEESDEQFQPKGDYLTEHQSLDDYYTKSEVDNKLLTYDANGHDYVDMGEAGIWATCNVEASKPEEAGLYFAWGEVEGYTQSDDIKNFTWDDYKFEGTNSNNTQSKYNQTDGLTTLELEDDAAHISMGGSWRMPTIEELQALCNACDTEWTDNYQGTGAKGRIFTLKTDNSKKLFFPACGFISDGSAQGSSSGAYWSGSLAIPEDYRSRCMIFGGTSSNILTEVTTPRNIGYLVRGILSQSADKYLTREEAKEEFDTIKDKIDSLEQKGYDDSELRQSISNLETNKADRSEIEDMATQTWVNDQQYLTEHQSLDNYYTKSEIDDKLLGLDNNGYSYVNMEEAGVWAICNIGATKPEESGLYFQWGDTQGYTEDQVGTDKVFDWSDYKYCNGSYNNLTKYCVSVSTGKVDNKTTLELEDDAAHVHMGGDWQMPSKNDLQKLIDFCDIQRVENYNETGVKGSLFTLKSNSSKKLFFPDGICEEDSHYNHPVYYYWTNELRPEICYYAYSTFEESRGYQINVVNRCYGLHIRGILKASSVNKEEVVKIWKGSQEDYNQLGSYNDNTFYLIKDEG